MAGPIVKSCCLCQSLKNGSIISGLLAIILSIITIILIFTVKLTFKTILFDWIPSHIVKIILVINLCMTILISTLMIVGTIKRNHYLMMPWVVLGIMICIGLVISVIYTVVELFKDDLAFTAVLCLIVGIIGCIILTYLWCVVYSQFAILSQEGERGRYNKQPYRR